MKEEISIKTGGICNLNLIDLHTHSTASDGTLSPRDLVRTAKELGLKAVAITDHDTVNGVAEAMSEGEELDIEVIPGVELSVEHPGGELHLLGYFLDLNCPELHDTLSRVQKYRDERNPRIIARLRELGFDITLEEVAQVAGGKVVGRPHIASVLMAKGYVSSIAEAFEKYLSTGGPAYVKKERLSPEEGIALVNKAKGIPVLAHPKHLPDKNLQAVDALVNRLKGLGLRGIEAYYTSHDSADQEAYLSLAQKYNLLATGGTDFHGANKPNIHLGTGLGNLRIPYTLLEEMKKIL